jgi:predicted double-glycine peptidase
MRTWSRAALLCALVVGAGRGSPEPRDVRVLPPHPLTVPLVRQQVDYSCGDVAALALLRYWKPSEYAGVDEAALYSPLGTTESNGTEPQPIASYIDGVPGLSARLERDADVSELEAAVDRGEPPIVDIQAWQSVDDPSALQPWAADWDDGHYVVLTDYDDATFFFMDPSTDDTYAYIPRSELLDRWHDKLGEGPDEQRLQHVAIFVKPTSPDVTPWRAAGARATPATPMY